MNKNQIDFVQNERNILNLVNNDYVVKGIYTFQSSDKLFFVMEYMFGGDFGHLLEVVGGLDEKVYVSNFYKL